jgi:hypothetical protein
MFKFVIELNRMKRTLLFLCLLSSFYFVNAQPLASVIKSQALEMGKALVVGDAKTFSRFMLPELLDEANKIGKANMTMDSAFAMFKAFGGNVEKISYGNPGKIVEFKNELQSTLPQTTEITSPFADVVLNSTLVAISRDKGKNWYFIDASMGKIDQLKKNLPNLSPDLVIPPPTPPKVTMKEQQ